MNKIVCLKDNLKKAIREAGYTQEQFAEKLDIDASTLRTYLSTKSRTLPDVTRLLEICNLLNCDVDYLLGNMPEKTHALALITETTGLSIEAIEAILYLKEGEGCDDLKLSTFNEMLKCKEFDDMLAYMANVRHAFSKSDIHDIMHPCFSDLESINILRKFEEYTGSQEYYAVKELGKLIDNIKIIRYSADLMIYDYLDYYYETFHRRFPSEEFSTAAEQIEVIRQCLITNTPLISKKG